MSSNNTIILITGANRGLGLQFFKKYASRPNMMVIAAVRDTESPSTKALNSVPLGKDSNIVIVKFDSVSAETGKRMCECLESDHSIDHLDLAIANAGISKHYATAIETPAEEMRDHWEVNALGMFLLFQAVWPLLKKAESPKFVTLSTIFSSVGDMEKYQAPNIAYGASKAAANFIIRKIHFEHPGLIAFPIHPGWVHTDQGSYGAKVLGAAPPILTPVQSVDGMVDKIDKATRESASGTFQAFDGIIVPW